jgi:FkbM family methyltransferase
MQMTILRSCRLGLLIVVLCLFTVSTLAQMDEEHYHHGHLHKKYIHHVYDKTKRLDQSKFRLLDFFGRHFYVMKPVAGTQDIVEWVNNGHFGEGKVSSTFERILRTGKVQSINGSVAENGACVSWKRGNGAEDAPLVLDIGANAGIYGLYTAALGCTTYFFDIQPVCQKWISESIHRNKFSDHAYLIPYGAGNSTTNITLEYTSNSCHGEFSLGSYYYKNAESFSSQHTQEKTTISIIRIDDLFHNAINTQTLPTIPLIKVDAEGYEPLIVAGMHNLMRAKDTNGNGIVRNAIIEIAPLRWKGNVDREEGARAFISTFWDAGFHKITFFVNNFKGKDVIVTDITDLHYMLVFNDLADGCQDAFFERTEEPP